MLCSGGRIDSKGGDGTSIAMRGPAQEYGGRLVVVREDGFRLKTKTGLEMRRGGLARKYDGAEGRDREPHACTVGIEMMTAKSRGRCTLYEVNYNPQYQHEPSHLVELRVYPFLVNAKPGPEPPRRRRIYAPICFDIA